MATNEELRTSTLTNNASLIASLAAEANRKPKAEDDQIAGELVGTVYIAPDSLLANDTDIDGDAIRGISLQNPVNGEVYWDGHQVIFMPTAGYSGPASFEYTITDDKGGYDHATVNLNVVANTAPVAVDDRVEGYANTDIVMPATTLLANDSDADGDALIGVSLQDVVNGTASWDGENVTFRPDTGYTGPASFSYTIADGHGATSTATVNLTVLANASPLAIDDHLDASAYNPLVISHNTLLANDSDIDGDTLIGIHLDRAEHGKVASDGENVIFTPKEGYEGPASFRYWVTDGKGGYDYATAHITVKPYVSATDDHIIAAHFDSFEVLGADLIRNDIGNSTKKLISVQNAEHGSVSLNEYGVITFTPDSNYTGEAAFTYTLQNGDGAVDMAKVNIEVRDEYVREISTESAYARDGCYAVDIYLNQGLSNSGTSSYYNIQHGSILTNYNDHLDTIVSAYWTTDDGYIGQASYDYSQYFYDFYAQHNYGIDYAFIIAGRVKVDVAENLAPTANEDGQTGLVDQVIITSVDRLLANDIDPEAQEIKIFSVQEAVNGTVTMQGNNVIFTPNAGYTGDASYTYTVIDQRNNQATSTVRLTIGGSETGSLTDESENITLEEDAQLQVSVDDTNNLLNNAQGLNPYIASYTIGDDDQVYYAGNEGKIELGKHSFSLTINSDGSYYYDDDSGGFFGEIPPIHYTIRDDNGNEVVSSLNINVTPLNDPPYVKDSIAFPEILMNQKQLITTTDTLLREYASDAEGDALTVTSVYSGHLGTVELIGNGVYFTPTAEAKGNGSFQFTVSDGNGGENTGVYHLRVVEERSQLLEAVDDSFNVKVSDALRIPVYFLQSNDTDDRNNFRHTTEISVHDAVNGTVALDGEYVVFKPAEGYSGPASFNYTIEVDEPVILSTATVNLMVNVEPVEPVLVAVDDTVVFDEFSDNYLISTYELKQNDLTQLDWFRYLNLEVLSQEGVDVGFENGIVLTPTADANGVATFQYSVDDGLGNIDTATVNLRFPQQQVPQGGNDRLFITDTNSVSMANAWLLRNDVDLNDDPLSIVSTQNAVNGEASLNGNQVSFTPTEYASEQASFQYSIHDGHQNYHFAQVDVSVQEDGNFVGTAGNDIMVANGVDNTINASAGDDLVIGGAGNDVLTGGLGADVFVWSSDDATLGEVAVDRITDFDLAEDKLDLKDLLNASIADLDFHYTTEKSLAAYLDFKDVEGSTEISIRDTIEGEIVQKILLEDVLLPWTHSPIADGQSLSNDANLLIEFRDNLIFS